MILWDGLAPRVLDTSPRPGGWFPAHLFVDRAVFGDDRPSALDGVSEAGERGRVAGRVAASAA